MALVLERVPFGADLDWSWAWRPNVAAAYNPREPRTQEYPSGLLAGYRGGNMRGFGQEEPGAMDWLKENWYYIVGGLAAAGLAYYLYTQSQEGAFGNLDDCNCGMGDFGKRKKLHRYRRR